MITKFLFSVDGSVMPSWFDIHEIPVTAVSYALISCSYFIDFKSFYFESHFCLLDDICNGFVMNVLAISSLSRSLSLYLLFFIVFLFSFCIK